MSVTRFVPANSGLFVISENQNIPVYPSHCIHRTSDWLGPNT